MRNDIASFRGEAPRLTPRALPPNGAQEATLARLLSGDLEAWRQFALEQALDNTGPVLSIYQLGTIWLAWDHDVDVARGALAGDTTLRIFLTGPAEYDRPRWTNLALAGAGNGPPAETRPLGVPAPEGAPVVVAGIDPTPTSFAIDILDEGDVLSTQWRTSSPVNEATFNSNVVQDAVDGNPAPCYQMSWRDQEVGTNLRRNFGVGKANAVTMNTDFWVNTVDGRSRFWAGVQRNEAGAGVSVQVDQSAAGDWYLSIGTGADWSQGQNQSTLVLSGVSHAITTDTWFRLVVSVVTNLDNTITVTASVKDLADVELLSATTGVTCPIGDWCGFGSGFDQLGDTSIARLDNIHVQAAGSTGYNPVNTATAYVYTYVNDQSEESAPSFASVDVLRPAGIAITVSSPTDTPTGIDSSWHIETKRIYRTVSGSTGNIFRFVAEIPLAQQDYVDSIPDTELGDELESEGWDLPPVDLRGMLALPNSTMAGFSGNQLCMSAPNRPHAWPVANRYTVDTNVVAIGNIDTTVVLGTEAFPYLAIGTDPAAYGMTKLEVPQACVAKRSLAYLTGFGVVFASPDGLIAIAGNGNVQNLTSGVFTRKQWQALVPESILGVAHDDVYHFFYDTDPPAPPIETVVLALFHMLNEEFLNSEGTFIGIDQTGASWTSPVDHSFVAAPGGFAPSAMAEGPVGSPSYARDVSQLDPIPNSFPRVANESFAIYLRAAATTAPGSGNGGASLGDDIGGANIQSGPANQTAFLTNGTNSVFLIGPAVLSGGAFVELLLSYDGTTARLFAAGLLVDSADINMAAMTSIKYLNVNVNDPSNDGYAIDEVYMVLGTPIETADYTPRTTEWPNP
jgi:hypothetical protein